jgi:hypothetical protein
MKRKVWWIRYPGKLGNDSRFIFSEPVNEAYALNEARKHWNFDKLPEGTEIHQGLEEKQYSENVENVRIEMKCQFCGDKLKEGEKHACTSCKECFDE